MSFRCSKGGPTCNRWRPSARRDAFFRSPRRRSPGVRARSGFAVSPSASSGAWGERCPDSDRIPGSRRLAAWRGAGRDRRPRGGCVARNGRNERRAHGRRVVVRAAGSHPRERLCGVIGEGEARSRRAPLGRCGDRRSPWLPRRSRADSSPARSLRWRHVEGGHGLPLAPDGCATATTRHARFLARPLVGRSVLVRPSAREGGRLGREPIGRAARVRGRSAFAAESAPLVGGQRREAPRARGRGVVGRAVVVGGVRGSRGGQGIHWFRPFERASDGAATSPLHSRCRRPARVEPPRYSRFRPWVRASVPVRAGASAETPHRGELAGAIDRALRRAAARSCSACLLRRARSASPTRSKRRRRGSG